MESEPITNNQLSNNTNIPQKNNFKFLLLIILLFIPIFGIGFVGGVVWQKNQIDTNEVNKQPLGVGKFPKISLTPNFTLTPTPSLSSTPSPMPIEVKINWTKYVFYGDGKDSLIKDKLGEYELSIKNASGPQDVGFYSSDEIEGNFIAEIAWKDFKSCGKSSCKIAFGTIKSDKNGVDYTNHIFISRQWWGSDQIDTEMVVENKWQVEQAIKANNANSGKFKIIRNGKEISVYFDVGYGYELLQKYARDMKAIRLYLLTGTWDLNPDVSGTFYNFKLFKT